MGTSYLYEIKKNGEWVRHIFPLERPSMRESVGYFTGKVTYKDQEIPVKDAWDVYVGDKALTVCLRGTELLVLKNTRFAGWQASLIDLSQDRTRLVERFSQAGIAFKVKRRRVNGGWAYRLSFKLEQDHYDLHIYDLQTTSINITNLL